GRLDLGVMSNTHSSTMAGERPMFFQCNFISQRFGSSIWGLSSRLIVTPSRNSQGRSCSVRARSAMTAVLRVADHSATVEMKSSPLKVVSKKVKTAIGSRGQFCQSSFSLGSLSVRLVPVLCCFGAWLDCKIATGVTKTENTEQTATPSNNPKINS